MRLFFVLGLLQSLATAQTDGGECTYAVELMFLQDTSFSFDPWVEQMGAEVRGMLANFTSTYAEFKMGVAAFVDKPIPTLGYGRYGNKPGEVDDYCYRLFTPLTSSPDALETGLDDMYWDMGAGGDWPEAPLEGLAYTAGDSNIGWSMESHSAGGRPIVRIALVVTDDVSHMPGDADKAIHQSWEYPRHWLKQQDSMGGFGSSWYFRASGAFYTDNDTRDEYMAMSDLFYKYDTGIITEAEAATLKENIDLFGPYPWPALQDNPNDGVDPSLCPVTEYIAPEALGALMKEKNIVPIFVSVANVAHGAEMNSVCAAYGIPADASCLQRYYQEQLDKMGVAGVSVTMKQTDLREKIIEAVSSVTEMMCVTSTSTTTEAPNPIPEDTEGEIVADSTEAPNPIPEDTEAEIVADSTEAPNPIPEDTEGEIVADSTEAPNPIPEDTEGEIVADSTEALNPIPEDTEGEIVADSTEAPNPIPEDTEGGVLADSTEGEKPIPEVTEGEKPGPEITEAQPTTGADGFVIPPPVTGGGSSTGTIAGATAGAVAGVAAIGGVLWKQFGASLFGNSSSLPIDTVQQVEVPENPIERETMEEVTMDMFQ